MKPNVYSPTQTMMWQECPLKRAIVYNGGWVPRQARAVDSAAILGQAFAAGIAVYNQARMRGETPDMGECTGTALGVVTESIMALGIQGRVIPPVEQSKFENLPARVTMALEKYPLVDPIDPAWEILGVEEDLGEEYGHARLDLRVRDNMGLAVVDYKVKLYLDKKYEAKEFQRWKDSWQQYHYLWGVSEKFGTPVRRYYIIPVILGPTFRVMMHQFDVHPETYAMWEASARSAWIDMTAEDTGQRLARMAAKHYTDFGLCEYYDFCFGAHLDESLVERGYVRKEGVR